MNTVAKYRYSKSSSPFDDVKNTYFLIGAGVLVVVICLVLCLTLQNSCGPQDIPVVEQGDGLEELPELPADSVVTSMGDILIDDGGTPVTDFEVTVTGADGTYKRSGEPEAGLTISGQTAESFAFVLTLPEKSVEGTAYFNGARSAICEKADGALNFVFDAGAVNVTTDGQLTELGELSADGLYALTEAATTTGASSTETTTTTAAQTGNVTYDLDVIKTDSVQNAMSGMMSAEDYSLTRDLLNAQGGYGIIYGTGDSAKEKNGRSFNLDTQMNAVMYYSFESGTGREVVIICSGDGKVYAGVCDGSEYRYYSNDAARKSAADAPKTITQYAKIKNLTLKG